jgi:hypothetical protein
MFHWFEYGRSKTVLLDCFIPLSTAVLFTGIESVNQNTLPYSNQWNMFYWSVTVDSCIFITISENTGTCSFITIQQYCFGNNAYIFSILKAKTFSFNEKKVVVVQISITTNHFCGKQTPWHERDNDM